MRLTHDWEFNVMGIYNYRKPGTFKPMFDYIAAHHDTIEGDIVDVGVYRGLTSLGLALFLKELGSSKKVYGFDSFSGFPPAPHPKDAFERYAEMRAAGQISEEHWREVLYYWETIGFLKGSKKLDQFTVSTSENFANTSKETLQRKVDYLGLDNVVLVAGFFSDTMVDTQPPSRIFVVNLDCDLYEGYVSTFRYVWPRLSPGGYIWLDEYYSLKFPGARLATDEFLAGQPDKPRMYPRNRGEFERWHIIKGGPNRP
jgi:hypothetical protein